MKIKNYRPSKGFIWSLLLILFIAWLIPKCVPLTEKEQQGRIKVLMEAENRRLAQEFDTVTDADRERLPEYDSRKYSVFKRNNRFWLISKEYGDGLGGFGIRWPDTVNKLMKKMEK